MSFISSWFSWILYEFDTFLYIFLGLIIHVDIFDEVEIDVSIMLEINVFFCFSPQFTAFIR